MKLFVDTANLDEIKKAAELGVICGVTTNPTLIAKEGLDFTQTIHAISQMVDGPISAEVLSPTADDMVTEAVSLAAIHKNVVVKVPICPEGLKAVKRLTEKGVRTNVTLIFSPAQALLAANAGASYISPFMGRVDDIGGSGSELVANIAQIFAVQGIQTEIIAASIRSSDHIVQAAMAGADIATVPYPILVQAITHPLTDIGIRKFNEDWEKAKQH